MIKALPSVDCESDDTASLRAALAVFDDWDSDLTALFELGHDASASYGREPKQTKTKTTEPIAPYRPRRDARKLEIAALREQLAELEGLVAVRSVPVETSVVSSAESLEVMAIRSEWERITGSQHKQRLAVEAENAKLRKLVESQVKISAKILKLTTRVTQLEEVLPALPTMSFESFSGPIINIETQLQRLDGMLPRAAGVFTSGAFEDERPSCFQHVRFRENQPNMRGVSIVYEASWVLPFEIERVAEALWVQTVNPTFKEKISSYEAIHEDATSLVRRFISTPISKGVWGGSQGQVATRRLPRDLGDGSFLILVTGKVHAYMESKWQGSADLEGWLRVESVTASEGQSGSKPLTRVKWSRQTLIQPPEVDTMTPQQLSKWTHAVIAGPTKTRFERDLEWSVQAIENMLVAPKTGG